MNIPKSDGAEGGVRDDDDDIVRKEDENSHFINGGESRELSLGI